LVEKQWGNECSVTRFWENPADMYGQQRRTDRIAYGSKEQGLRPDIHVLKRPKNSGVQKLEFGRFASLQTEHGGVSAELPTDPLSGSLLGRENGA